MTSIFDRIANRKAFPVEINGETIHLCELTFDEISRIEAMPDPKAKTGLTLALCLVGEKGEKTFPPEQKEGEKPETDLSLAQRVLEFAGVLTPKDMKQIQEAIEKLMKPVDAEELAKN